MFKKKQTKRDGIVSWILVAFAFVFQDVSPTKLTNIILIINALHIFLQLLSNLGDFLFFSRLFCI